MIIEKFDSEKIYHELKKFNCGHAGIDKFVVGRSLKKHAVSSYAIAFTVLDDTKGIPPDFHGDVSIKVEIGDTFAHHVDGTNLSVQRVDISPRRVLCRHSRRGPTLV